MPDTQNAFLPAPASPQAYLPKSYSYKPTSHKGSDAALSDQNAATENGEQDSTLIAPFLALLTQAVEMAGSEPESPPVLDLLFSAEHGQTKEEYAASLPLGTGDKQTFSKSIWDLMASLKSDLGKKGVDVDALSGEVNDALEEIGADALPDWNLKTVEAMLSRLSDRYATTLDSDGPRNIDIQVSVSDYLKFGLEASLNGSVEADAPEASEDGAEESEPSTEAAAQPEGDVKAAAHNYALPPTGVIDDNENSGNSVKTDTDAQAVEQPWTVSKLYSYLKTDVQKAAAPKENLNAEDAQAAKPSDKQTLLLKDGGVSAKPLNADSELGKEFAGNLGGQGEQEKQSGDTARKDANAGAKDASARPASKETARLTGDDNEPKTKTNFTEQKATFEQFFDSVMERRGTSNSSSAAPALELAKGAPLSQGEALREGLDNVVRFIRSNSEQKATMTVDPPALGRVSVELVSNSTGLEASIKVSSEQVRQVIQDHLAQLKLSLEQQGVQLTHFSVDVQQDNERRNQGQGDTRRKGGGRADEEDAADDEALFRVDLNQGLLYWIA